MARRKKTSPPALRVGTSGYQYDHWRGILYEPGLPKRRWFQRYAEHFDTVEINNTFYRMPAAATFESWHDAAPAGFCFALKYSRYGSHLKHLKDPAQHVDYYLQRAEHLGELMGPTLVQLPPRWKRDTERLRAFLHAAPRRHRWAVEFREPSWLCDEIYDLLRAHNAALCIHDLIDDHPRVVTADWVYLRFHGGADHGNYRPDALAAAADHVRDHLAEGRDVYAYFNNDQRGYAVANARDLRDRARQRRAA